MRPSWLRLWRCACGAPLASTPHPSCDLLLLLLQNEAALTELYSLLAENYVEDDECSFRFNYSAPFLKWCGWEGLWRSSCFPHCYSHPHLSDPPRALTPPGYFPEWIVGVRTTAKGRLVACITGVPASLRAHEHALRLCEINFLCVHKKLRAKRLAPVLIKEVTRRVNLCGIFQVRSGDGGGERGGGRLTTPAPPPTPPPPHPSPPPAGRLHGRRRPPEARRELQVLAPDARREEAHRDGLHAPPGVWVGGGGELGVFVCGGRAPLLPLVRSPPRTLAPPPPPSSRA